MWTLLAGCQEPFGTDRHDLVGFRIAAIAAPAVTSGDAFVARAAVVVDGRGWATEPASLEWGFVADPEEATGPFAVDATGADPVLRAPAGARTLVLRARHGGEERRAFLTLAEPPGTLVAPSGFDVGPVGLPLRPRGPELVRDARLSLAPGSGRAVEPGGWLRIDAGAADGARTRFMATGGTFLELDAHVTDWVARDGLVLDEDEVDPVGRRLDPGTVTVLALRLTGGGETAFAATEVFVGDEPDGVWLGGRFVPADGLPPTDGTLAVRTTLREDAEAPSGFRLEGGQTLSAGTVSDWGTPDLPCAPSVDGPLDPDWFLTQRCTPVGADGTEVVVIPSSAPPGAAP
jgi:hypothetical protein